MTLQTEASPLACLEEQTQLYRQSLCSAVQKQQSTCWGIRESIKRLQNELTLELAVLEDMQMQIDELYDVVE
jgi:hypothetical protein